MAVSEAATSAHLAIVLFPNSSLSLLTAHVSEYVPDFPGAPRAGVHTCWGGPQRHLLRKAPLSGSGSLGRLSSSQPRSRRNNLLESATLGAVHLKASSGGYKKKFILGSTLKAYKNTASDVIWKHTTFQ
jgi:hypothetical protein